MKTSDEEALLVWSNAPDEVCAERLASALVEEQLAACVHVFAAGRSIYRWQGNIEQASESTLLIKTTRAAHDALVARLCQLHPYDVPEVLAVPVCDGLPAYLDWLFLQTKTRDE